MYLLGVQFYKKAEKRSQQGIGSRELGCSAFSDLRSGECWGSGLGNHGFPGRAGTWRGSPDPRNASKGNRRFRSQTTRRSSSPCRRSCDGNRAKTNKPEETKTPFIKTETLEHSRKI